MIFDPETKALYTDSGAFIKRVFCPRQLHVEDLEVAVTGREVRTCAACEDEVHDLESFTEDALVAAVAANPTLCVFAVDIQNVVRVVRTGRQVNLGHAWSERRPQRLLRTIHTVRDVDEIERLAGAGVQLLIQAVTYDNAIREKVEVWRRRVTGELLVNTDYRFNPSREDDQWEVEIPWHHYRGTYPKGPLAAYIVPPDIKVGEAVYLEDLIEDVVAVVNDAQDFADRRTSAEAVWNGKFFELHAAYRRPMPVCG